MVARLQRDRGREECNYVASPPKRITVIERFETFNMSKIARDNLARWKQVKDVWSFNEDFQKTLLDIHKIALEEQMDRYAREL